MKYKRKSWNQEHVNIGRKINSSPPSQEQKTLDGIITSTFLKEQEAIGGRQIKDIAGKKHDKKQISNQYTSY